MDWERGGQGRGRRRTRRSRGAGLRRTGFVLFSAGGIMLAGTAVGSGYLERVWAAAGADERFVAAVHEQDRWVMGDPPDPLVVAAAQKLCERRAGTDTFVELRSSALTPDEIDAVRRTFGDDSEAFLKVALRTYCPLNP